jgi:hypothetical protein
MAGVDMLVVFLGELCCKGHQMPGLGSLTSEFGCLLVPLDHLSGQALEAALLLKISLGVVGLDLGPQVGNSILEGATCTDEGDGLEEQVPKRVLGPDSPSSLGWLLRQWIKMVQIK